MCFCVELIINHGQREREKVFAGLRVICTNVAPSSLGVYENLRQMLSPYGPRKQG